jgi:hypothetical protein
VAVNCWVWVVPGVRIMFGLAGVTVMDVSVAEEEVVLAEGLALCGAWPPPHCINAAEIIKDRDKANTIFSPLVIVFSYFVYCPI